MRPPSALHLGRLLHELKQISLTKPFVPSAPLPHPPTLTFTQASALALCCRHSGHIPCIPVKCGYTLFALHSVADVPSELESLMLLRSYNPKPQRMFSCRLFPSLPSLALSHTPSRVFCPLHFLFDCSAFHLLVACRNLLQAC